MTTAVDERKKCFSKGKKFRRVLDELKTGEIRQMGLGLRWRRISAAQLQHSQVQHAKKPIPRGKEFMMVPST